MILAVSSAVFVTDDDVFTKNLYTMALLKAIICQMTENEVIYWPGK